MDSTRFEKRVLIMLSVMLVGVFLMSLHMYDSMENGTNEGVLATFAQAARNLVYENDSVAAFLGIEENEVLTSPAPDTREQALAYIERYNRAYGDV